MKSSLGYEYWYEYDADGNMIHSKDAAGSEQWLEYNSHGNFIHTKNSNGVEQWHKYIYVKVNGKRLVKWDLGWIEPIANR